MEQNKVKFALRMEPQMQQLVKDLYPRDNCKSQNEFIEKAIRFYAGYVSAKDSAEFLAHTLTSTLRGLFDDSENRIARLLFKLAVEQSITMNVVASGMEIGDADLRRLRARCVDDVKKSNGSISFDDAARLQSGQ